MERRWREKKLDKKIYSTFYWATEEKVLKGPKILDGSSTTITGILFSKEE